MSKDATVIQSPADFGLAVLAAREAAEMSQRELSARTDVTQSAISNIESGRVTRSGERLFKLLVECGVTVTAEWDDPVAERLGFPPRIDVVRPFPAVRFGAQ